MANVRVGRPSARKSLGFAGTLIPPVGGKGCSRQKSAPGWTQTFLRVARDSLGAWSHNSLNRSSAKGHFLDITSGVDFGCEPRKTFACIANSTLIFRLTKWERKSLAFDYFVVLLGSVLTPCAFGANW
jgi:hypothetical protein